MTKTPAFRGGRVHVAAALCETCIFRKHTPAVRPKGLLAIVRQAIERESAIVCHSTIGGREAVCRGFFNKHKTAPLQIAERLGLVEFQEGKQMKRFSDVIAAAAKGKQIA